MKEQEVKHWWTIAKEKPFLVISIFIVSLVISWGVLSYFNAENLSSKVNLIETKQAIIDEKDIQLGLKDEKITELRHEILKNNLKNNAINISINNENIQSTNFVNWSCTEKDIIINEFANKINDQDEALIICKNNYENIQQDYINLEKEIPNYSKGFVGRDIPVYKGSTFQADGGKFTLSVVDTTSSALSNAYSTTFRLNGVGYTKNIGEYAIFEYYGTNYTINLKSTGNPAIFYIYRTVIE
jgi:hypothetical protein